MPLVRSFFCQSLQARPHARIAAYHREITFLQNPQMWKSAFHHRVMHLSASAGAAAIFFVRSYIRNLAFRTPKTCIYAPKNRPSGFLHMEILKGRYTFLTTKKLFLDGLTDRWTTGRTPPDTGRTHKIGILGAPSDTPDPYVFIWKS